MSSIKRTFEGAKKSLNTVDDVAYRNNSDESNLEQKKRSNILLCLHGVFYQTKLLMLYLVGGVRKEYSFRLSTELKEAKKFDDVIFLRDENGEKQYFLLQAKHRIEQFTKIRLNNDLLHGHLSKGDYTLLKYFFSYQECKDEELFKKGKIKDIILCTNIDFDLDRKVAEKYSGDYISIKDIVTEIDYENDILNFKNENLERKPRFYKFSENIFPYFKTILERYLVTRLTKCLLENSFIDHNSKKDIFHIYHKVLAEEVINVENKKFYDKFIRNEGISEEAQRLKKDLENEVKLTSKHLLTLEKINDEICEKMVIKKKKVKINPIHAYKQGLNLSKGFGNLKDKNVCEHNLNFLIKEFFEHLVFAVDQPRQSELDEIIKNNLSKDFGYALKDISFDVILVEMLNWANGQGNEFISQEDGKKWFQNLKHNLSGTLKLENETIKFKYKIENDDIFFQSNIVQKLDLGNPTNQIFNIVSEESALTSIKLYQVLQNKNEMKSRDNYFFMQLKSVLENKSEVITTFNERDFLLIIDCTSEEENSQIEDLYSDLLSIIEKDENKNIILITKPDDILVKLFKNQIKNKYQEIVDDQNNFTDLQSDSQEQLLQNSKVTFQGKELNLGTLIESMDLENLIDKFTLSKLINKEQIEIGKSLMDSLDVKNYFISRTFNRQVYIEETFKEDESFVVIKLYEDICNISILPEQDIIIISNEIKIFEKLCKEYKQYNIHWLKLKANKFVWQQTHNNLSKLRKYCHDSASHFQMNIKDLNDKIVIIGGDPGIGKTTILTEIAKTLKNVNHNNWICKINLRDCSSQFSTWKQNGATVKQTLQFLFKNILFQKSNDNIIMEFVNIEDNYKISLTNDKVDVRGTDLLELGLFIQYYNQGKLILLFDGFDEIAPDYKIIVIALFKYFKKSQTHVLWITSRNYNILDELENELGSFSYSLEPFSENDQINFLQKFWKFKLGLTELDTNKFLPFANQLFKQISKSIFYQGTTFLSIPLHICMVAECFEDEFRLFYASNCIELSEELKSQLNKKMNLATLYKAFLDKKFYEILHQDINLTIPGNRCLLENEYRKLVGNHTQLALQSVFSIENLKKMFPTREVSDVSSLLEKIKIGSEKTGIIIKIVDERPVFIHLTFAEYFIANFFWEEFKSISERSVKDFITIVIIQYLIADKKVQICNFLQSIAREDLEFRILEEYENYKFYMLFELLCQKFFLDIPNITIYENTTMPIDLVFNILESWIKMGQNCNLKIVENFLGWLVNKEQRKELLNYFAKQGYTKIIYFLRKTLKQSLPFHNAIRFYDWTDNPLYLALYNEHFETAKLLIMEYNYETTWIDPKGYDLLTFLLQQHQFNLIKRCFELNLLNYNTNCLLKENKTVFVYCIENRAPKDLIKLIIEKEKGNIIKNADTNDAFTFNLFYKYDEEITQLLINNGFDFTKSLEIITREIFNLDFYISKRFYLNKQNYNCFDKITMLLRSDSIQFSVDMPKFLLQAQSIIQFLTVAHESHDYENLENCSLDNKIFKLIIECIDRYSENKIFQIGFNSVSNSNYLQYEIDKKVEIWSYYMFKIDNLFNYSKENDFDKFIVETYNALNDITEKKLDFDLEDTNFTKLAKWLVKDTREKGKNIHLAKEKAKQEILKFKDLKNRIAEFQVLNKINVSEAYVTANEIYYLLNIEKINLNEELQNLVKNVFDCGGITKLFEIWEKLRLIKNDKNVLEHFVRLGVKSKKIDVIQDCLKIVQ